MSWCTRLDTCFRWKHRKWLFLILGVIEMLLFSGFHYGYNTLKGDFKKLGIFEDQCGEQNCTTQPMIDYAFSAWVNTQMLLVTGTGFLMDKVGLRFVKILSVVLYSMGSFMFAFTKRTTAGLLFPAGIFVAIGSVSSLVCNHQISSMFPTAQGLVISMLSGAYDSSSAVTFVIASISDTVPLQTSFIAIAIGSLIFGIPMGLFVMKQWAPDMAKQSDRETACDEFEVTYGDVKLEGQEEEKKDLMDVDGRIQSAVNKRFPTSKSCILSLPFAAVLLWFMFGLFRLTYFFSQLVPILFYAFPEDEPTIYSLLEMSSFLFAAGFVVSPFTGFILVYSKAFFRRKIERALIEKNGQMSDNEVYWTYLQSMAPGFLLMAISGILFSSLQLVKSKVTFIITCVLLSVYRSLLFSTCVNFVLIAFPLRNFGTVNGTEYIGGIFNTLENALKQAPIFPGTIISIGISCVLLVTPLFLLFKRR
ncbi:Solute carrier family 43 member 3 [Fasciola gigantica]|uniref:Solute carrier family 43 member 3 n=1 Tax=Fasciola gigantica TaxID=46835 RepID=A0A504YZK2_FASGI|nr:Solute carrier family 43 member 3 [Fasciola gigantica]